MTLRAQPGVCEYKKPADMNCSLLSPRGHKTTYTSPHAVCDEATACTEHGASSGAADLAGPADLFGAAGQDRIALCHIAGGSHGTLRHQPHWAQWYRANPGDAASTAPRAWLHAVIWLAAPGTATVQG